MNKIKDLLARMEGKLNEAKANPEKASELMGEYDALKAEYETAKKIDEAEKAMAEVSAVEVKPVAEEKALSTDELVAKGVRYAFNPLAHAMEKDFSATVGKDGQFTIPDDAQTAINKYKEAYAALSNEITTESVSTPKGSRVFQKRGRPGAFSKLATAGLSDSSGKVANPEFEQVEYNIEDYAGFMPVPNNLIDDSDANIAGVVYEWLGKAQADTDNAEILDLLGQTGTSAMGTGWTAMANFDAIKKAVNVTLGQAFANTAKIYTNDDGAQYFAELKEKSDSNKPLLTPVITDPAKKQLSVGFRSLPVVILPNEVLKSVAATTTAKGKIPVIIGDLKEAIVKFDRKSMEIAVSKEATIGTSNAFAKNMTLFRAILRADYVLKDEKAVVKGYIETPKLTS